MKKILLKYLIVFIILIGFFMIYSTLVCLLPTKPIKENIEKSLPELLEQGNYPYAIINKKPYQMDNFTDGIFLSQNYKIDSKEPLKSAMLASIAVWSWDLPQTLEAQINNSVTQYRDYPRYWNGNTFLLRPLLLLTDYSNIRWVLYAVSSMLLFLLSILLYKNIGLKKMLAFTFGLICVNYFVTQFSMQFFTSVNLAITACITICLSYKKNPQSVPLILFIFGCLTSYFDLLTTPLLTLGLPLIVFLMLREETTLIDGLKKIITYSLVWGIGFAFCWASKWAIGTLLTDINVFKDAYENIIIHTGNIDFSRREVLKVNFDLLPKAFIYIILIALFIISALFFNKKGYKNSILLLIVAIFPYIWFLVLSNHSYVHFWFTYRIQAISIICIFLAFINMISWNKIYNFLNRFKIKKLSN